MMYAPEVGRVVAALVLVVTASCGGEAVPGTAAVGVAGGTGVSALPPGHPTGAPGGMGALPPAHPMPGMGADPHAPGMGDPHGGAGGMGMGAPMGGGGAPASITWTAPEGWVAKPPSSKMRIAEFVLAHAEGDAEDATLAVFWFGGGGGTVDANIGRWLGQFVQPDGRATKDVAKTDKRTVGAYRVTTVDVTGTFNAEMMPGSGVTSTKTGWRMLGAVIEAPEGSYFVKAIGPQKTLELWKASFDAFLASLKPPAV